MSLSEHTQEAAETLKIPERHLQCLPALGAVGAYLYIAGVTLPYGKNIPLLVLALLVVLATIRGETQHRFLAHVPLVVPVCLFLLATGVSTVLSVNVGYSVRGDIGLLPALVLFFLLAGHGDDLRESRRLCLVFTTVAFGLACMVLWAGWQSQGVAPQVWVRAIGSPFLTVPNDVTSLALIAPLALGIFYREPRSWEGFLAAAALLMSIGAVVLLQSRVATLTMLVSLGCAATLLRPWFGFICGCAALFIILLVDSLLGFPLVAKFGQLWDARLSLWFVAWSLFLDAPVFGNGPHTFGLLYRSRLQELPMPAWLTLDAHANVPWAHNLYLGILAEQGMIGLAALVFLFACGFTLAWRTYRTNSGERQIFAAGAFAGLVGVCLAALFELTLIREWVGIVLFSLFGLISQLSSASRYSTTQIRSTKEDKVWLQSLVAEKR